MGLLVVFLCVCERQHTATTIHQALHQHTMYYIYL